MRKVIIESANIKWYSRFMSARAEIYKIQSEQEDNLYLKGLADGIECALEELNKCLKDFEHLNKIEENY